LTGSTVHPASTKRLHQQPVAGLEHLDLDRVGLKLQDATD
jgi:hypothetical protein